MGVCRKYLVSRKSDMHFFTSFVQTSLVDPMSRTGLRNLANCAGMSVLVCRAVRSATVYMCNEWVGMWVGLRRAETLVVYRMQLQGSLKVRAGKEDATRLILLRDLRVEWFSLTPPPPTVYLPGMYGCSPLSLLPM